MTTDLRGDISVSESGEANSDARCPLKPAPSARALRIKSLALFVLPLIVAGGIWQLLAETGILDTRLAPAPSKIAARLLTLATSDGDYLLWKNIWASASRVIPALLVAAVIGVLLGVAIGLSVKANDYLSGVLGLLLPLPAVAWTPVFVVSIGRGFTTMLIVLVLGAVFPILYNVMTGVQGIAEREIWAVRSLGGSRFDAFIRVVLPSAWPSILAGLRLGVGHAWRTLVAVELLTSASIGLGALIFRARGSVDTTTMYASIVALAVIGLVIDQAVFRPWENRTLGRWGI